MRATRRSCGSSKTVVFISGTVNVAGRNNINASGGIGGPGGFPGGGWGGNPGPGSGGGTAAGYGGAASYGTVGGTYNGTAAGTVYGDNYLIPLLGGSGGGGGTHNCGPSSTRHQSVGRACRKHSRAKSRLQRGQRHAQADELRHRSVPAQALSATMARSLLAVARTIRHLS
jgi:hypothetical protein